MARKLMVNLLAMGSPRPLFFSGSHFDKRLPILAIGLTIIPFFTSAASKGHLKAPRKPARSDL